MNFLDYMSVISVFAGSQSSSTRGTDISFSSGSSFSSVQQVSQYNIKLINEPHTICPRFDTTQQALIHNLILAFIMRQCLNACRNQLCQDFGFQVDFVVKARPRNLSNLRWPTNQSNLVMEGKFRPACPSHLHLLCIARVNLLMNDTY